MLINVGGIPHFQTRLSDMMAHCVALISGSTFHFHGHASHRNALRGKNAACWGNIRATTMLVPLGGESLPLWHYEPFGFVFLGGIPLNSNGLSLLSSLSPYDWWHFVGVPWYTQVSHLNNGSISTVWGLRKLLWSTSDARDAPHTTFLLECAD